MYNLRLKVLFYFSRIENRSNVVFISKFAEGSSKIKINSPFLISRLIFFKAVHPSPHSQETSFNKFMIIPRTELSIILCSNHFYQEVPHAFLFQVNCLFEIREFGQLFEWFLNDEPPQVQFYSLQVL